MQTPPIDYCLVCDDIRVEAGNKATLLGFYGVLPTVRIILKEWDKPLEKITFLISRYGATRQYSAQFKIINPDATTLATSNVVTATPAPDESSSSAVGFSFPMLTFRQEGKHGVEVLIDNQAVYHSTFLVQSLRAPSMV